jgi:hypothetical protein
MAIKKKAQRVSKTLRQAVKDSGQSLYDIAHGAGIKYSMLTRFVSEDMALAQRETPGRQIQAQTTLFNARNLPRLPAEVPKILANPRTVRNACNFPDIA